MNEVKIKTDLFTTLRAKITVFIVILLFVTAAIFSLLTVHTMNTHILREVIKRAESLCKSAAALAPYSILSSDVLGVDNIVSKIKDANSDVKYMAVIKRDMTILAHTDVTKRRGKFELTPGDLIKENKDGTLVYEVRSNPENYFEILTPIVFHDKRIGAIVIGINKSVLLDARMETRKRILAGFVVTLFLGIGCIVVLSSFITRPIKDLTEGVNELKEGRISKLRIYSHDELGKLTASFNHMAALITSQQAKLAKDARELEEAYVSTVKVLAAAIDARDSYTLGHSTRVATLSLKIGKAMGLSQRELEDLEIECLFHDVGKLKTPDFILFKDGPLDQEGHREIARHSEDGAAILSRAPSLHKYILTVRHHHEWFNGRGYPDGLSGEDIPLHAAIIAVADAFDAMTSARPYKDALSKEDAVQEMVRCAGKQFNPRVVEVFLDVVELSSVSSEQFSGRR